MVANNSAPALGHEVEIAGSWQIVAKVPGKRPVNVSVFRDAPTKISEMSFSDPFGPRSLTLNFGHITMFEKLGEGELYWLSPETQVDVTWNGVTPWDYPFGTYQSGGGIGPKWTWEGYVESFSWDSGVTVQLKGAMYQADNYLAKPEYVARPLPYEHAIARQFRSRPSLRLLPMAIIWPSWWDRTYLPVPKARAWEIPAGVSRGANWTGLLTRSTGAWDPVLTSYIQQMLSTMYTHRGRWTLELFAGRKPVLLHRDNKVAGSDGLVTIDPVLPGIEITLSNDFSQSMTTLFGQGKSLSGVSYSGMNVSVNGDQTTYTPLASTRQTWPADGTNPWLDSSTMAREVMMQTQDGLDLEQAQAVARNHLARFSDPGYTGTITLKTDPEYNGYYINRHLVRAGMDVHIPRLFGRDEGIVAHITESRSDIESDTVTLQIDTKFRDALTASEVRLRGRDAMQVPRMLIAGAYKPVVPDQLVPWSYTAGSGYIPSNDLNSSVKLFKGMPTTTRFPWTSWTRTRPPSNRLWKSSYIRLAGPASMQNADNNWASHSSGKVSKVAIPIRMGQAGTVRLLQIAAYKSDGSVYKVPFHVSFYYVSSTSFRSMPLISSQNPVVPPPGHTYANGQHHPFAKDAWETHKTDGTQQHPETPQPWVQQGLVRAYGNYYEKAGFWPGSYSGGGQPTGLLVDEEQWSWDISGVGDAVFDPYSVERNLSNPQSGWLYMMIFCENHTQDVYFLGRIFRVEPSEGQR